MKIGLTCSAMACCSGLTAEEIELHLDDQGAGAYFVEGRFRVRASRQDVWDVLTDYGHISDFVSSVRSSTVTQRHEDYLILEQKSVAKAIFFSRTVHVRLKVQTEPFKSIAFEDIAHDDFEIYQGSWRVQEAAEGLSVVYSVTAKYNSSVPRFITKGAFFKNAKDLLAQVQKEIIRRAQRHPKQSGYEISRFGEEMATSLQR